MQLRSGIPLISEVDALVKEDEFRRHLESNQRFLEAHAPAMRSYGYRWGEDPLKLWSRRWEYPFVAQKVLAFAAENAGKPLSILDAGSGVTYFDYYLCDLIPQAAVVCCDYDPSYDKMFEAINAATPGSRVSFKRAILQQLPLENRSVDAICCISVLEHTDRYEQILDEFARVLRPGGSLVLTFDLSLDGRFELSRQDAQRLLADVQRKFVVHDGTDHEKELARMSDQGEILSTNRVRQTHPELLPWRRPVLKALHDLLTGKGWTWGFRSKSVYCLEVRGKA